MPKTIILTLASISPEYSLVDAAYRTTWGMEEHTDIKIFPYYGNVSTNGNIIEDVFSCYPETDKTCLDNQGRLIHNCTDIVKVDAVDKSLDTRARRFIGALEYCLKNFEFDFIYRTSHTCYVDVNKLYSYTCNFTPEKIYSGPRYFLENEWSMEPSWKSSFVAGFNCLMSKDVIQALVDNKELYLNFNAPEDIAIGHVVVDALKYVDIKQQDPNQTFTFSRGPEGDIEYSDNPFIFNYKLGKSKKQVQNFFKLHNIIKTINE